MCNERFTNWRKFMRISNRKSNSNKTVNFIHFILYYLFFFSCIVPITSRSEELRSIHPLRDIDLYRTHISNVEKLSSSKDYYDKKEMVDSFIKEKQIDIYEAGYPFPYIGINYLSCGNTKIIFESFCERVDNALAYPICQFHKLIHMSDKTEKSFYFLNLYHENTGYPYSPFSIQCKRNRNGNMIILNWSNLGSGSSCEECESSDIFQIDGNYLGTTREKTDFSFVTQNKKFSKEDIKEVESSELINEVKINLMPNGFNRNH